MSVPPLNMIPPVTPGPIRVHRPRDSPRFMPYDLPAATLRKAHDQERNENRPPPLGIHSMLPSTGNQSALSTPLRRHASASVLMDSSAGNWSPFSMPPASSTASLSGDLLTDPVLQAQQMIRKLDLGRFQTEVYDFAQASSADRELLLLGQILKLRDDLQMSTLAIKENKEHVVELKTYVSNNWALSKPQEELLSGLLGHWLVKPLRTYDKIYVRVGRYAHLRAEWLHLGVYVTDPLARLTIDRYLQTQIGIMKSSFRKEIVKAMETNKPLDSLSRTMLQKYHAPVIPAEPPRDTMAALVFLRRIAANLVDAVPASKDSTTSTTACSNEDAAVPSQAISPAVGDANMNAHGESESGPGAPAPHVTERSGKRADKGDDGKEKANNKYWHRVENALDVLYGRYGDDRTSLNWKKWEDQIIEDDTRRYKAQIRRAGRTSKTTAAGTPSVQPAGSAPGPSESDDLAPTTSGLITFAEDMEREAAEEHTGHQPPTFNLYRASAIPIEFPAGTMNGDVDILDLGNVADTLNAAL